MTENPDVHIQLGTKRSPVAAGWHFGSCFPGNTSTVAVYDFVPDALLLKVANLEEFLGILAFDKWTANADARQSIFLRARLREFARASAEHPLRTGFLALMMDHGYIINEPFYLWIMRKGVMLPIFAAYFDEESWKAPNKLG